MVAEESTTRKRRIIIGWFIPKTEYVKLFPDKCTPALLKKIKWDEDAGQKGKLIDPIDGRSVPARCWEITDDLDKKVSLQTELADTESSVRAGEVCAIFMCARGSAGGQVSNTTPRKDRNDEPAPYADLWEDLEMIGAETNEPGTASASAKKKPKKGAGATTPPTPGGAHPKRAVVKDTVVMPLELLAAETVSPPAV